MSTKTAVERFMDRVQVDPESGCWVWTKSTDSNGYGRLQVEGRQLRAHRYAWELFIGPIPEGAVIDHLCHVTSCANPVHLRIATVSDNSLNQSRLKANNSSGYRGVSFRADRPESPWRAEATVRGVRKYLGVYPTPVEAAMAVAQYRNERAVVWDSTEDRMWEGVQNERVNTELSPA